MPLIYSPRLNKHYLYLFGLFFSLCADASIDEEKMHAATVEVVVTLANGQQSVASGFLWQKQNQIITALHAIRPKPASIRIQCKGSPYRARVVKYLRAADLALLETDSMVENCEPLKQKSNSRPAVLAPLVAFGKLPTQEGTTGNVIRKGTHNPETLKGFNNRQMHQVLELLGIPDPDMPLFKVNGVIMKGLSGGPVINADGLLVGIVQGGMDKGLIDQNWVIPAKHIDQLMSQPEVDDISFNLEDMPHFFSFTIVKSANELPRQAQSNEITNTNEKAIQVLEYSDPNNDYLWISNKTRTLDQILLSADPSSGIEALYDSIVPNSVPVNLKSVPFDIFIENTFGLVIAVPSGAKLVHKKYGNDWRLYADFPSAPSTFIEIQHGQYRFNDGSGGKISPSDERFFGYYVDSMLEKCAASSITCIPLPEQTLVTDYGNNNRVFRFGFYLADASNGTENFYYHSVAAQGNDAFIVSATIDAKDDSPFWKCQSQDTPSTCGKDYWKSAAFVLATGLTNISSMLADGKTPSTWTFEYTCDGCITPSNPEASITRYQNAQGETVFLQHSSEGWYYVDESDWLAFEILQHGDIFEDGGDYTLLQNPSNGERFALPSRGGEYYSVDGSGNANPLGILQLAM